MIPALAVGRELNALRPDLELLYIGAPNSLEERLARAEDIAFAAVSISPLRRGVMLPNLNVPVKALLSVAQAGRHLKKHRARFVFGSGGFSSWPACAAARLLRLPYFLEDGNAYPGLVTRLLAPAAARVYLSHNETRRHLRIRPDRALLTGVPVSSRIGADDQKNARRALGLAPDRTTILATGGSGGAQTINRAMNEAQEELLSKGFNIIWQTGKQWDGSMDVPVGLKERLLIERFLDPPRMALGLSAADIAVARCGMMTLAELAALGVPAILVPFPHSAEGHQEANARAIVAAGGGLMILDRDLTGGSLQKAVVEMLAQKRYASLKEGMKSLARPDAARRMAEDILGVLKC